MALAPCAVTHAPLSASRVCPEHSTCGVLWCHSDRHAADLEKLNIKWIWNSGMFASPNLQKCLTSETGPGRPHFTAAKGLSHHSPKPPPGSAHDNCNTTPEPSEEGTAPPVSPPQFSLTHSSCCLETSLAGAEVCRFGLMGASYCLLLMRAQIGRHWKLQTKT